VKKYLLQAAQKNPDASYKDEVKSENKIFISDFTSSFRIVSVFSAAC